MSGLNKVQLIGYLGMDPELRNSQAGMSVMRLRMATTETWSADGERKERTEWHTVVFFGKRADGLSRHLRKGMRVYVEGGLQTREWEKDGVRRYTTEVVGRELLFLDGKRDGERRDSSTRVERGQGTTSGPGYSAIRDDFGDDEIPF